MLETNLFERTLKNNVVVRVVGVNFDWQQGDVRYPNDYHEVRLYVGATLRSSISITGDPYLYKTKRIDEMLSYAEGYCDGMMDKDINVDNKVGTDVRQPVPLEFLPASQAKALLDQGHTLIKKAETDRAQKTLRGHGSGRYEYTDGDKVYSTVSGGFWTLYRNWFTLADNRPTLLVTEPETAVGNNAAYWRGVAQQALNVYAETGDHEAGYDTLRTALRVLE